MTDSDVVPTQARRTQERRGLRLAWMFLLILLACGLGYGLGSFADLINPHDYRSWTHGNTQEESVTSPDGRMDAVIYCYCNTPAMVSPYFYLHILPSGRVHDESSSPAILVSRRNLHVKWKDNAHLEVMPDQGEIEYFRNLWAPKDPALPFVEIILKQNQEDPLLTPDGTFVQ